MEKSYHAYCMGYQGVWRVKIPSFDKSDKPDEPELRIEPVFTCDPDLLPTDMGLFSCGHIVYMAGGNDNPLRSKDINRTGYKLFAFDPNRFQEEELPIKNPHFLYEQLKLPCDKMKHLLSPMAIQANQKIYFLTQYVNPWFGVSIEGLCFQSFNQIDKSFQVLTSPPYTPPAAELNIRPGRDEVTRFMVVAYFAAFGYIYLFIRINYSRRNELAFRFDTTSSTWKETEHEFNEENIPIPSFHRGDTGVSEVFSDCSRILVALCDTKPIAYRVMPGEDGSLKPQSFRFLEETKSHDPYSSDDPDGLAQLHDIGSGRFCVIYKSFDIPLKVYVFKIDFEAEHRIQTSEVSSEKSSLILCSRRFSNSIPLISNPSFYAYCLASAPASQSSGDQSAPQSSGNQSASEEQDRERNPKRKKNNE